MKKNLFSLVAVLALGSAVQAQMFQGKIDFAFAVTGENAAMAQAVMPTAMHLTVGKTAVLTEIEGGMMAAMMGKILVDTKKGQTWIINDAEETAYLLKKEDSEESAPTPTKEDETITISGYECQKYSIEMEQGGMTMTQYLWAAEKLQVPQAKEGATNPMGSLMGGGNNKVNGLPLKTMTSVMGMTVSMTATNVSSTPPAKNALKIPKGYKKSEIDAASLMGGGM